MSALTITPAALNALTLDSVAGVRTGSVSRVTAEGEFCAVRFALSKPRFAVRELPGDLDGEGKLALVRRLIREGLVVVHSA